MYEKYEDDDAFHVDQLTLEDPYLIGIYRDDGVYLPGSQKDGGRLGDTTRHIVTVSRSGTYYLAASHDRWLCGETFEISLHDLGGVGLNCTWLGVDELTSSTPTNLQATATNGAVTLTWTTPKWPVASYKIERQLPGRLGYTTLAEDTGNTNTTQVDSDVSTNGIYRYRVWTIDTGGYQSAYHSNIAAVRIGPEEPDVSGPNPSEDPVQMESDMLNDIVHGCFVYEYVDENGETLRQTNVPAIITCVPLRHLTTLTCVPADDPGRYDRFRYSVQRNNHVILIGSYVDQLNIFSAGGRAASAVTAIPPSIPGLLPKHVFFALDTNLERLYLSPPPRCAD